MIFYGISAVFNVRNNWQRATGTNEELRLVLELAQLSVDDQLMLANRLPLWDGRVIGDVDLVTVTVNPIGFAVQRAVGMFVEYLDTPYTSVILGVPVQRRRYRVQAYGSNLPADMVLAWAENQVRLRAIGLVFEHTKNNPYEIEG